MISNRSKVLSVFAASLAAALLGASSPAAAEPVTIVCSYPGSGFEHVKVVFDEQRSTISIYPNGKTPLASSYKTIVDPSILEGDHVTHKAEISSDFIKWKSVGSKWIDGDALAPVIDGADQASIERKTGELTVKWLPNKTLAPWAHENGVCIRRGNTNLF